MNWAVFAVWSVACELIVSCEVNASHNPKAVENAGGTRDAALGSAAAWTGPILPGLPPSSNRMSSARRATLSAPRPALVATASGPGSNLAGCGRGQPPEPLWSEFVVRAPNFEGRLIGVRGTLTSYRAPPGVGLPCAAGGACAPQQHYGLAIATNQRDTSPLAIKGFACAGTGATPCDEMPIGSEAVAVGRLERVGASSPRWKLTGASLCVVKACFDCEPGSW